VKARWDLSWKIGRVDLQILYFGLWDKSLGVDIWVIFFMEEMAIM
jgi:hypothetical protein